MKLMDFSKIFNKSSVYNEYLNVFDIECNYDRITKSKMIAQIIEYYINNPKKIVEYCNCDELKLLSKVSNKKIKKYEFDNLYGQLARRFLLLPEKDLFDVPDELKDAVKIAVKDIDYKKIEKRDIINNRIIGLMKLYGVIHIDMLVDMYNHYYDDYKNFNECKNYILNSFYLRHYIFIDGDICEYNDYYNYVEYILDNEINDIEFKCFEKEEVESISKSKFNIDDKYVNKIEKIFNKCNIPNTYLDVFINYSKEVLDKGLSPKLIENKIRDYLRIYSKKIDLSSDISEILSILFNVPCVIFKGNSLIEMLEKDRVKKSIEKSKKHGKKISEKEIVSKYKNLRKESIDALNLCGDITSKDGNLIRRYINLLNVNNIKMDDMTSLFCHMVHFIPIDDELPIIHDVIKENISINNKYYEILNELKNYNYNSLFLVKKVFSNDGIILLYDTKTNKEIKIVDISLSASTEIENKYIYTSLFNVEDIYFTAGYIIPLMFDSYDELVKKLLIEKKRIKGTKNEEMKELLATYKLYSKNKNISFSAIDVV